MNKKLTFLAVLVSALLLGMLSLTTPTEAASVDPDFVAGNPSCQDLGYAFGFKVDPPDGGTYDIDGINTVTVTTDGTYFDWSSTLGIDAVIAKGGPNANLYVYDPPAEATSDTDLHSPINPNNNKPFGLSHIEFCYDYEVEVEKTAETSFTRTFNWTIDKSVTPETWDLFTGDSGTSEYTVTVTKGDFTDSDWAVSGTITIDNNTPLDATIDSVSDVVSPNIGANVDCGVTFPYTLTSGDTLECTYDTPLPDGSDRTNTATVTTSGPVGGGEAEADVIFGDPTTVVNDTINVSDTFAGNLGGFSDSGSTQYERTFSCDGDEGQHDNTATIVETGQSASASVTVNCYALTVTKEADTSFNRIWEWTIDKSADQTDLLLSEGQLFQVNYEVTVNATSTDSNYAVSGNIFVNNPAPIAATLNSVSDVVSPDIDAVVQCSVTFPYTLAAGDTLPCAYSAVLPDNADRTNTATATLQNFDYDSEGVGTPNGTTDFSGSANVDFSNATVIESDECIDVNDTNVGFLGTVCANEVLPKTFTYSLWFGAHPDADVVLECGDNTHTNVADFVTNDTGATGDDDHTVNANVSCQQGCTLTPGYWKTHSEFGPAPYDDTWASLPNGANTTFFSSSQTYYQVLWTAPQGNAYYILAHAYIAAELNQLNGASIPGDVQIAFNQATALFNQYTPAQVGALKGNSPVRKQFIALGETLDDYNNGLTGPGHCSE